MKRNGKKPFLKQIRAAFVIVILIPVLCLGGFIFYSSRVYIHEQRLAASSNMVRQNLADLENWVEQCELSLRYLAGNYTLQEFLRMDETQYISVNQAIREVNPLLYNAILTNPYYKNITIYTEKNFVADTALIKQPESEREREGYKKIMGMPAMYWWYNEEKFYLGKKIVTSYPEETLGVIVVELKEDSFENYFKTFRELPIEIELTSDQTPFYQYSNTDEADGWGFEEEHSLGDTGWKINYRISEGYFSQNILTEFGIPMLIIIAVLFIVWICISIVSKYLIRDLSVLVSEVNEVKQGNLDVTIQPSSTEEIHVLAQSVEEMLHRIKQLIHQVYAKEIERQNMELDLLQAKISPHFLYNNLSAINWLAIDCGEEKISEITTEMATFYRTALNKGKNIDCLSVEIRNIKAYINLQLIAHEDEFDVEYEIDETLGKCMIPIFILQPLVENSIEHGIEQLEDERGRIKVTIQKKAECLYLTVFDNGKELYEKIGDSYMSEKDYGYGTGNVNKRIKLLYGEECGLRIRADAEGTTAVINLNLKDLTGR